MKVLCDGVEVVSLSDNQKKVLAYNIPSDALDADLKRRVAWVLNHKYEQAMKNFRAEWEPKLKADGAKSLPCGDEDFCALVFSRADYKDRSARDAAQKLADRQSQ